MRKSATAKERYSYRSFAPECYKALRGIVNIYVAKLNQNLYYLFLFFGVGNSSTIAINSSFKNSLESISSTNSISFAPS